MFCHVLSLKASERFVDAFRERFEFEQCSLVSAADTSSAALPAYKLLSLRRWANQQQHPQLRGGTLAVAGSGSGRAQLSPSLHHLRPMSQLVTGAEQSSSFITQNRMFRPTSTRPPTAASHSGPHMEQHQQLLDPDPDDVTVTRVPAQSPGVSAAPNNLVLRTSDGGAGREQVFSERQRPQQLRSLRNTFAAAQGTGATALLSNRMSMLADSALVHYPGVQNLLIDLSNPPFTQLPQKLCLEHSLSNTATDSTRMASGAATTSNALTAPSPHTSATAVARSLSSTDELERHLEVIEPMIPTPTPKTESLRLAAQAISPSRFKQQQQQPEEKPQPKQQPKSTSSEKTTRLASRDYAQGNSVFETVSSLRSVLIDSPSANASDRDEVFSFRTPHELPPRTREGNVYLNLCDMSSLTRGICESEQREREGSSVVSAPPLPLPQSKSSSARKQKQKQKQSRLPGEEPQPQVLDFPSYVRPQAPSLVAAPSPHSGVAASVCSTRSSRSNASLIESATPNPLGESRMDKSSASASELSKPALLDVRAAAAQQQPVCRERDQRGGRERASLDSQQASGSREIEKERAPPQKKKRASASAQHAGQQQSTQLQKRPPDEQSGAERISEALLEYENEYGNHEAESRQQAARFSPAEAELPVRAASARQSRAPQENESHSAPRRELYAKNARGVLSDMELARWNASEDVSAENTASAAAGSNTARGGPFSSSASERCVRGSRTQEREGAGATRKAALSEQRGVQQSFSAECCSASGVAPTTGPPERNSRANFSGNKNRMEPEAPAGAAATMSLTGDVRSRSMQNTSTTTAETHQFARGLSESGAPEIGRSSDLNDLIDPHTGVIRRAKIHRLRTRRQSSESTSASNQTDSASDPTAAETAPAGVLSGGFPSPSEYENTGSDFSEKVHVEKLWQLKLHSDASHANIHKEQNARTRSPVVVCAPAPASVARGSSVHADTQFDADSTRAEIESNSSLEDEDRRRLNRISETNIADGNDDPDVEDGDDVVYENENENEAEEESDHEAEAESASFLLGVLAPLASTSARASAATGTRAVAVPSNFHANAADVSSAAAAAAGSRGRTRRQQPQPRRPRSRGLTMRLAHAFENSGAHKSSAYSDLIEKEAMKLSRALCSLNSERGLPSEDEELVEHQLRASNPNPNQNPNPDQKQNPSTAHPTAACATDANQNNQTSPQGASSSGSSDSKNPPPLALPYQWLQLRPPSRARYTPFTISEVGDDDDDEERARETDLELDSERPGSVSEVDTEETDFDPHELLEEYSTTSAASTYDNRAQRWLMRPPAPLPLPLPLPIALGKQGSAAGKTHVTTRK